MYELNKKAEKSDGRIYADDLKIKTTNLNEIYSKLTALEGDWGRYRIEVNWIKIVILVRKKIKRPENPKNCSLWNTDELKEKHTETSSGKK